MARVGGESGSARAAGGLAVRHFDAVGGLVIVRVGLDVLKEVSSRREAGAAGGEEKEGHGWQRCPSTRPPSCFFFCLHSQPHPGGQPTKGHAFPHPPLHPPTHTLSIYLITRSSAAPSRASPPSRTGPSESHPCACAAAQPACEQRRGRLRAGWCPRRGGRCGCERRQPPSWRMWSSEIRGREGEKAGWRRGERTREVTHPPFSVHTPIPSSQPHHASSSR